MARSKSAKSRSKWSARLEATFKSAAQARHAAAAMSGQRAWARSAVILKPRGKKLTIEIQATDQGALRATLNSTERLLSVVKAVAKATGD